MMAPAKENGGLDNLAFDVSAIFYPPKNIEYIKIDVQDWCDVFLHHKELHYCVVG